MVFFQEHELALIDTNAYVMGIWNHEKHETHEMAYTDRFGCGVFKNTDMHQLARILGLWGIEGNRVITRMCVHGCDVFQEHGYAPIGTNAYVMGILNHEKHETHEMAYTDGFG